MTAPTTLYAVVMAGGSGTRFWPLSRHDRPKQLLAIGTERPLIVETVARLAPLVPLERVVVVAGAHHAPAIRALLPELPEGGLIVEPCARNTAPCIGLAALHLARRDPHAVMAVLPADHHVADRLAYQRVLRAAAERAAQGEIVTIGIRPTRPETGYGYIRYTRQGVQTDSHGVEICAVERFVEKPPASVAAKYLEDGHYLWNSGMFFFTPARILSDIERLLPGLHRGLQRIDRAIGTPDEASVLAETFAELDSVSIDYGVMEHAERVRVLPADIGWNDVGHWAALPDFAPSDAHGNVVRGQTVLIDARANIVHAEGGPLVALVGAEEMVVVATRDVVLVCPRDRAQDVRRVVDELTRLGREDLK